jgi:hypothetical protein
MPFRNHDVNVDDILLKSCNGCDINVKNGYTVTPFQNHNNVKCEDLDTILHQSCDM